MPTIIDGVGLLFVGDCKMSALATPAHIAHLNPQYSVLALTGRRRRNCRRGSQRLTQRADPGVAYTEDDQGERRLLAVGDAFERRVTAVVADGEHTWTERVLVVRSKRSPSPLAGLEKRLQRATVRLLALSPAPGRGKRQIQEENALITAADAILQQQAVEGLLTYTFERQEQRKRSIWAVGAGTHRPQREIITVHYQMTAVSRQAEALAAQQATLGWRAYVTNAPAPQLTWGRSSPIGMNG